MHGDHTFTLIGVVGDEDNKNSEEQCVKYVMGLYNKEMEESKWLPLNQSCAWTLVSKEESLWAVTSCCCCQAEIRDENMKRKGVGKS